MWLIHLFYAMPLQRKNPASESFTDDMIKKLALRIRSLREKKGYTNYEKFAYEHDISRSQYGRYERGENLTYLSLVKIAAAFEMSLAEFFSEGFD